MTRPDKRRVQTRRGELCQWDSSSPSATRGQGEHRARLTDDRSAVEEEERRGREHQTGQEADPAAQSPAQGEHHREQREERQQRPRQPHGELRVPQEASQ